MIPQKRKFQSSKFAKAKLRYFAIFCHTFVLYITRKKIPTDLKVPNVYFPVKKTGGLEKILNAVIGASGQPRSQGVFVARGGCKETRDVAVRLACFCDTK